VEGTFEGQERETVADQGDIDEYEEDTGFEEDGEGAVDAADTETVEVISVKKQATKHQDAEELEANDDTATICETEPSKEVPRDVTADETAPGEVEEIASRDDVRS
jgi:hypothetical protein